MVYENLKVDAREINDGANSSLRKGVALASYKHLLKWPMAIAASTFIGGEVINLAAQYYSIPFQDYMALFPDKTRIFSGAMVAVSGLMSTFMTLGLDGKLSYFCKRENKTIKKLEEDIDKLYFRTMDGFCAEEKRADLKEVISRYNNNSNREKGLKEERSAKVKALNDTNLKSDFFFFSEVDWKEKQRDRYKPLKFLEEIEEIRYSRR